MTGSPASGNRVAVKSLVGALMSVVVIGLLMTYILRCPCERMPGTVLSGIEVTDSVSDWSFVNRERLCQIEVQGLIPWSVNLNCMADKDGSLFVSCSRCDGKYWSGRALANPNARIRVGKDIYPVTLSRVVQTERLDHAWRVRASKIGIGAEQVRPNHWWSFAVVSR